MALNTLTFSLTPSGGIPGVAAVLHTWTISDADLQNLSIWAAAAFSGYIQANFNTPPVPGFTPTINQILQAWIGSLLASSVQAEQRNRQQPAPVPTPIAIIQTA